MQSTGFRRIDADRTHDVERGQAFERPIPVAQIDIIEIGLRCVLKALHEVEVLRSWHVNWPQHHGVQHAEHHRVRPNPNASVRIAVTANPGDFLNCRNAILKSLVILPPLQGITRHRADGSLDLRCCGASPQTLQL